MRLAFDPAAPPADRDALAARQFAGLYLGEPRRGPFPGGRSVALQKLHDYDAARYGKSRNFLDAPVSRLNPYLRHGMINAVEVRDHLRERYRNQPQAIEEFLRQLAWRDFFDKALDYYGQDFQWDVEEPKHQVARRTPLPTDIEAGRTGLPCMDGILSDLFTTGYLHNHERLWFAAYVCHFRGIKWTEGARLFRQHLYDGDWASNTASWQWVESTFANKPYFMNQENVARYSNNRWCADCRVNCPFRASYEQLEVRLFRGSEAPLAGNTGGNVARPVPLTTADERPSEPPAETRRADTVVWLHDATVSSTDPALTANPDAAVVFVFDEEWMRAEPFNFHRVAFLLDGLADLFAAIPNPIKQVRLGKFDAEVRAFANEVSAKTVALTDGPFPGVRATAEALKGEFAVSSVARPVFADYHDEPKRFTRYWTKVAPQVLGYNPNKKSKFHK